jgi:hypothetical protein
MIVECVPEDNKFYENFLLLLDIVDLVFAPITTVGRTSLLRENFQLHHANSKELYPTAHIAPKMH